jgi:hypothetical protein
MKLCFIAIKGREKPMSNGVKSVFVQVGASIVAIFGKLGKDTFKN